MAGKESLAREVRRLAMPAIAASLLQTLVFVVDRLMLGRHSETSLAAMQIAGPIEWSTFTIFAAFEVGTIARVGNRVGAGDLPGARRAAIASMWIAVGAGIFVAFLTPLVLRLAPFAAREASPAVHAASNDYLSLVLYASPALYIAWTCVATLQASGDTRTPLAIGVVANLAHLGMNRVLILGAFGIPAMGTRGAGISTTITFVIEAMLGLLALSLRSARVGLRRSIPSPEGAYREATRDVVRVGWPATVERAAYHVGFLAYIGIIGLLGDAAMAANQSLISVESICFLSGDGFGIAAAALVAQKLGAGKPDDASRAARLSTRDAVITLTAFGLAVLLLRNLILPLFTTDPKIVAIGLESVPVLAIAQPFMAVGIVMAHALRGAGMTRTVLLVSLVGALGVRIVATYTFAIILHLGLEGVWWGSTADWVVRSVLLVFIARRGFK